tara:strand:- start:166 stop:555 length:390 start_codon:yes stop_codon:yes gene_type:complete
MNEYKIGMSVSFGRPNGEQTIGKIVKVNPKKLKIEQTEVRGSRKTHAVGTVWTVPKDPQFVTILEEGSTPTQKKASATKPKTAKTFTLAQIREAVDIITGDDGHKSKQVLEVLKANAALNYWSEIDGVV